MNSNYERFEVIKDPVPGRAYKVGGEWYYYLKNKYNDKWERCCWTTLARAPEEVGATYICPACKTELLPVLEDEFVELVRGKIDESDDLEAA